MHSLMGVLRRTWLATTLLVAVSTAVWWMWIDWDTARLHLLPTLILSPVLWWLVVGQKRPPHLLRGLVAGALTGLLTQMVPHARYVWPLLIHRGMGDGEAQMMATASTVFYVLIASGALLMGAVIGLLATAIERRTQR